MTAEEIRKTQLLRDTVPSHLNSDPGDIPAKTFYVLREIAAQLADLNRAITELSCEVENREGKKYTALVIAEPIAKLRLA